MRSLRVASAAYASRFISQRGGVLPGWGSGRRGDDPREPTPRCPSTGLGSAGILIANTGYLQRGINMANFNKSQKQGPEGRFLECPDKS